MQMQAGTAAKHEKKWTMIITTWFQASVNHVKLAYLEHTERSIITFVLPRYAAPGVRQATPASTGVRRPLEYATLSFKCSVPRAGLPASSMYCAARYAARQVQSFQALNLGLPYRLYCCCVIFTGLKWKIRQNDNGGTSFDHDLWSKGKLSLFYRILGPFRFTQNVLCVIF